MATVTPPARYDGQDLEALADIRRYQSWLLESFRPRLVGRRVLEVGAGIGNLSEQYVDETSEAVLVEPAENLAGRLRDRFVNHKHVRTIGGSMETAARLLAPASFESCILVNVLEHVEDDAGMLWHLQDLLKPKGSLLLFVPALPVLYGTLDALVHHHRRYTKASLRRVVEGAGFLVEHLRYFDVLGAVPWFVAGRMLRRPRFDETAARLYDRFVVPVGAALERVYEPPFGKNLVCIASRCGTGRPL
jgi:SAM-dependent methyltransferase